jgi:hypothetical protein
MIYLITDGEKVKIGYSKDPLKRLKQLQTGHPKLLRLMKVYNAPNWVEKRIHYIIRWDRTRGRGEWFDLKGNEQSFLELVDKIVDIAVSEGWWRKSPRGSKGYLTDI